MGPKHGIARGVAVFGSPRIDPAAELADQRLGARGLVTWARDEHGIELSNDEAGLQLLEAHLDEWRRDPVVAPRLANEAGLFLGGVIVGEVPGARWIAWPNGHPVVRLSNGRDVDVTALAAHRVTNDHATLLGVLDGARRA